MEANDKIVLVGAGNMATALAVALAGAGNAPLAVWSRTSESAQMLADRVGAEWCCDIDALPQADIVIISIVDSALRQVTAQVARKYPDAIILHTAGSIPMSALHESGANRYGVLYPMQTVNKTNVVPLNDVTVFIEGSDNDVTAHVERLARTISNKVVYATSEQRCSLHVAAVFACNFSNAVYNMAAEILEKNGLPFESMLPLIDEAARKMHTLSPREAQTGPAKRGDSNVMNAHKAMLDDELSAIYSQLSDYIKKRNRL
ncbi:MAG: DUF2520 domain-containing protein [Bacteroidaceae bacterium]|nr:DUF2520 domain-containing protein [Bacteroidaceae bacterium]